MPIFKLYSRPHSIAIIDDDPIFLELLEMALPTDWHLILYSQTHLLQDYLRQQSLFAQRDVAVFKKIFEDAHSDLHILSKVINYWRQTPQRWGQTEVAILDYAMPKMTGLQLLNSLDNWHGKNILLTGIADETIAVQAFNEDLIQRYIPKQTDDVVDAIANAVQHLSSGFFRPYQSLCELNLSPDQLMLLRKVEMQDFLRQFAVKHWIEYVTIASPFGVLGLGKQGQLSWLQIERSCDIDDLKWIANSEAWDAPTLEQIHSGQMLSNSMLRQSLAGAISSDITPTIPVGDSGLIVAHFEFEAPQTQGGEVNYESWLKAHLDRTIR